MEKNETFGLDSMMNTTTGTGMNILHSGFNICIGHYAGELLTDGHHNIYLGDNSGKDQVSEAYHLRIGERYVKKLTHEQWDILYAALQWIIAGNDQYIGKDIPVTGNDSTKIGMENKWYKK